MSTAKNHSPKTVDSPSLISISKAAQLLKHPDVVAVDASWHMPSSERDGKTEYTREHLPGAVFIDIDAVANTRSPLPHMLPTERQFAAAMSKLGISNTTRVIVYDSHGLFSAARVWWMLRAFGHKQVAILDGGLPAWKAANKPLEQGVTRRLPATYKATLIPRMVASKDELLDNLKRSKKRERQVLDARSAARFYGREVEPRAGLRSGHIPGSKMVHYASLIDPDTGKMKGKAELRKQFSAAAADPARPSITSCGSGVTAAIIGFALHLLGNDNWQLYDGSWAEWGQDDEQGNNTPVDLPLAEQTGYALPGLITCDATFTHLEMTAPPTKKLPNAPRGRKLALMKMETPTLDYYRYLFVQVGRPWHWTERLVMEDDTLLALITHPKLDIYVLYVDGVPAGFAELDFRELPRAKIAYFGLMPDFIGQGLGYYFLRAIISIAWQALPGTLWVSTNTNDHPRALAFYQKAGFSVQQQFVGRELMFIEQ